ncbi:hypothetical protein [Lacihabitans lacunae]|uniref:Uncharacterized protein n=1 Tax=Lacihabitans lacunae TaxID=1028214 RepID=A0ABV7YQV3_9BACT
MSYSGSVSDFQNNANDFAEVICKEFFISKEAISGAEIINLTEVKQLNLFILRELYAEWQKETDKLKSPFFDYNEPEAKKALEDFMNVLSRYILVKKDDFKPILQKATKSTLELYNDPKTFFNEQLRALPNFKLDQSWLSKNGKFFKDYSWVLIELSNRLNGTTFVYVNEAIDWINDLLTSDKKEDFSKNIKDIMEIVALNGNQVEEKGKSFFDSINTHAENEPQPKIERNLAFVAPKLEEVVVDPIVEEIKPEPVKLVSEDVFVEEKKDQIAFAETITESIKVEVAEPKVENKFLNETLNDVHNRKNGETTSLSDFHAKRKIESIKGNISLNQRFLFINNLFGSKSSEFDQAIEELETCQTFGEAKDQMIKKYMSQYKWDLKSPESEEFFDLLKRRYNN